MLRTHLELVFSNRKDWINWYSTDRDLLGRNTERFEINARFFERHEVTLVMMDQPHRVHVKVRDDNHLPAHESLFRFEPRHDFSRQKVSTNNQIRLVLTQQLHKRARIQLVEC